MSLNAPFVFLTLALDLVIFSELPMDISSNFVSSSRWYFNASFFPTIFLLMSAPFANISITPHKAIHFLFYKEILILFFSQIPFGAIRKYVTQILRLLDHPTTFITHRNAQAYDPLCYVTLERVNPLQSKKKHTCTSPKEPQMKVKV